MLHVVAEIEQDVGGEEDIGEGTVAADPFPSFNAVTSDDNSAMVVKVNTQRLEQYLQSIREKLSNYEAAMHEQHEILNKLSKADETKIAKLSVKLDHCIIDVNTFKDFVLSRQVSSSDLDAIGSKCNFAETKSDHKYMISQLQSEVSALSLMVRRIELSQAEGLDSFAQIKQLNSALKLVTKELDSLGKNSVILELREHVDRVVLSIRNDIQQAADQREADIQEVRQSFSSLEEDRLAMMEQRLQVIEEKAILYDMVLSEQEGVAGAEGDDGGELNSERNDNLLLSEKVGFAGMEAITEDGEPLRPSQMLLRGISDVGFAEDDDGSGGPPSPNAINTDSAAASAAAGATTEVAGAVVRLGSGIFQNMSSKSSVKGGRANRSLTTDGFAGRGAVVQSFTFAGSGRYSSGGSSQKSQKHQQQGVGSREREGSFAVGSIGGGGKRGRESALKRSSFFTNLLGQYVSRENHEQDLDAERAFAQAGIFGLQKQLKVLAAGRMGGVLSRALRDIVRWKVRHCFTQLVSNVQSWHTVRNRRNRSKALMFQVRLHSLTSKRILRMGLEYWRRVTWLFRERERLKLWLRTKLQHWLNMKIPNVKLYLNRWKRFTVHSYYSSLFVEDEGEDETTG